MGKTIGFDGDFLAHKNGFKYISRERKGKNWVYTYPDDGGGASRKNTGSIKPGTDGSKKMAYYQPEVEKRPTLSEVSIRPGVDGSKKVAYYQPDAEKRPPESRLNNIRTRTEARPTESRLNNVRTSTEARSPESRLNNVRTRIEDASITELKKNKSFMEKMNDFFTDIIKKITQKLS